MSIWRTGGVSVARDLRRTVVGWPAMRCGRDVVGVSDEAARDQERQNQLRARAKHTGPAALTVAMLNGVLEPGAVNATSVASSLPRALQSWARARTTRSHQHIAMRRGCSA